MPHLRDGGRGRKGYNATTMTYSRRAMLVLLSVLVAVFVSLHPALGFAVPCDSGGSLHATQAHGCSSAIPSVTLAKATVHSLGTWRLDSNLLLSQTHLSPDLPPPQIVASR